MPNFHALSEVNDLKQTFPSVCFLQARENHLPVGCYSVLVNAPPVTLLLKASSWFAVCRGKSGPLTVIPVLSTEKSRGLGGKK